MARIDPISSSFSTGEVSKLLSGRVDIAKYPAGVDTLENYLIMLQGGTTRRPGLRYIAETKTSSKASRLMPFQYSADQDYVIEIGDEYMRFFTNNAGTVDLDTGFDLDYMEYATDGVAQTAYVTSDPVVVAPTLLVHFNGADGATTYTSEDTGARTITFVGTAQLDTAQKKFGTASLLLDGNSDYVTVPDSADWDFGTGDFTIDTWVRFNATGVNEFIFDVGSANIAGNGVSLFYGSANTLKMYIEGVEVYSNAWTPSTAQWYHIAASRSGTSLRVFVDGTQLGSTVTNSSNIVVAGQGVTIGSVSVNGGSNFFNGWIDEPRILKGTAGWTSNFTPPTSEYSASTTGGSLQSYSEATLKSQGTYSLKAIAAITTSLNKTLTRTLGSPVDLTDIDTIKFDIRSSRTGANIKIGIHDSGGTTSEKTYTVLAANTWETVTWDISAVTSANKDAIDSIIITIVNADAANTFYIDNMYPVRTEITSPYDVLDIFQVQQAHKGDLKYLTHGDYASRKLSRTTATAFSIDLVSFVRGPFLDTNTTAIAITPTLDAGATTLNAASGNIFHYDAADGGATDQLLVGSLFRVKSGVVKIISVVTALQATGTVQAEPDGSAGGLATGPGATTDWAEGAFSGYRGYPSVCAFHDGRLWYACTEYEPQKGWGSNLYDYENFDVGSAADDEAVTFEIATEERVAIRWLSSGNKALSIGSTGGTFSAYGTGNGPITPTDIQVNRDTNYGSALLPAKKISSFLYYIQRNLHKIRELSYFYDYDITRASDMTMLAEHILRDGSGVVDWDYQQSPNDRLWCVRDDGEIAVITRNPEQDVMGWARIIAGKDSTGNGQFESVCVIPKAEADDQVWVVVRRMIDGVEKRFIEFFTNENFEEEWDAVCLDCSLTLDNAKTITGMTNASPGVFTSASHGFTGGEQVKINGILLSDIAGVESLDINGIYLLVYINANTFSLTTLLGVAINPTIATGYGVYISGGEIREMVTDISGLGHLEGETVQVTMDGDVPTSNSFEVMSGSITLPSKAAVVHAGLPFRPYMKTLRPEGGSQIGTAQGKVKRIPKMTARFYRTSDCKIGTVDRQDRFTFDELYTGDKDIPVPIGWEKEGQLVVTSDRPLPLTLISLMPNISVSDL